MGEIYLTELSSRETNLQIFLMTARLAERQYLYDVKEMHTLKI